MSSAALELSKAFGFLKQDEVLLIQEIAKKVPVGANVVNIGAGVGTSGIAVIESNPNVKLYTIDISESSPFGGLENERNAFNKYGIPFKHSQINSDSISAGLLNWSPGIFMLIIDDDHNANHLSLELDIWLQHVVKSGYILLHDYNSEFWWEIKDVIDEKLLRNTSRYALYKIADTMISFIKL
ncbi:MAG: hypothetical protein HPY87_08980 [Fervidobacterium sp.]|uniref:class I SAM-dependent methyltransferase n=1 Tax=Fervidobacterium sp. TaxID=1871331 RepID=UPI0025C21931|nr:class I SAM-dependent methyltransferase [Fervidobacterium sp.]NPU89994.1 hypothetical protein [Fervidobacterium sp.]